MLDADTSEGESFAPLGDDELLAHFFGRVEEEQYDLNRRAAARAEALADAIAFARAKPWIYALAGDFEPEKTAERCAVVEASARLLLSETAVRSLAATADQARAALPLLWARAREGFAAIAQIETAVGLLPRFHPSDALALGEFDRVLADVVLSSPPASFRARAVRLARRLAPQPEAVLHERAMDERRVVIESAPDGMSWVSALVATQDAIAIKRRLTATAKHLKKQAGDIRTRDQLRADLFTGWLRGSGTPTAVTTKLFVTVPLHRLAPEARATVRTDASPRAGIDLSREPLLLGEGALDDSTAIRLLLEAGRFTRVITDPVTGVVLDMDRRARTVTPAQREWLVLTHGICTRDGCHRSAAGAEIDHWREFSGAERGPTDLENLHPFCGSDHRLKGTTRLAFRRRPDGSVQLRSPTGFATSAEAPEPRPPEPRPPDRASADGVEPDDDPYFLDILDRLLRGRTTPEEPPF